MYTGWVGATEMGGTIASYIDAHARHLENVPPEKAAAGVVKVLQHLTEKDNGSLFNFDGTEIPW
jgi:hypothetical protein